MLQYTAGQGAMPALPSLFLALFTAAPTSDAGTGGTEVSGGSYARVQVAGTLTANGTISTGSSSITMNVSNPGWVVAGMNVYDTTNNKQIGTVLTYSGTALTLTANASNNGSGSTDVLSFSAFAPPTASSGNEPGTTPGTIVNTNATITFVQASASWGTVLAWAIYDAVTSGNMIFWDYLGNFSWRPFTGTSASPSVLTAPAHGYANSDVVVVTSKYQGTLPATGGSWSGTLTVANVSTDTFTAGVNTTGTGSGQVRKITQQSIPQNVTASFSTSQLTISLA